jgi:hypothetical protein
MPVEELGVAEALLRGDAFIIGISFNATTKA